MKFEDADIVASICWQLRYGDYVRGQNRARINALFNGVSPYTEAEVQENNIEVNVNWLEATSLSHDARQQFNQAFNKPGAFFTCTTDAGPVHKRSERSHIVTKEIAKVMKRSLQYFESMRSKFAQLVLHGIGPSVWPDKDRWCPRALGVEDLLVPATTLLTFENLPFFVVQRSFTAAELIRLARGPKRDKGWNQKLVTECLKWVDQEAMSLIASNYPEIWSPEKLGERLKGDGAIYTGDQVPTIDVFDFWFHSDEEEHSGWRRRMILDDWSMPANVAGAWTRDANMDFARGQWLYDSGKRVFAEDREQIFSCQFADLSAVAPFRYHTVRSLGYLLYAVCHLQNRLRCRFTEAVFENLMLYFRVNNADDSQRSLKVDLINRGFIDDTIQFIPPNERWQIDKQLAELGLNENSRLIARNASSYTTTMAQQAVDKREKTKFEVMAEVSTATQLVNAALQQAYQYQVFEYREIFRRFLKRNPVDPDVVAFQARCLTQGVPSSMLHNISAWDIEPERIIGGGNKAMEMAISQQLLAMRNLYDPEAQREILRDVTLAITDDAAKANQLVPKAPVVTDSIHDAQLRFGTLMQGVPIAVKGGVNHIEVIETLLGSMGMVIQRIQQSGGVPQNVDEVVGLATVGQHIAQEIQLLAQDENEKQRVKQYGDVLGKMMNEVRAFGQRLQEKLQKENGQSGLNPEAIAKVQTMIMQAQAKAQNTRESHAQRTAQRQIQFEMEQARKQQEFEAEMAREAQRTGQEMASENLRTAQELQHNEARASQETET